MPMRYGFVAAMILGVLLSIPVRASDWPRFRGPNGSGVSADEKPAPVTWGATENLKWKVSLPGPGSSSPIVVRNRVFVTCWSGYGTDRGSSGDQANLRRHLICLDRHTGDTLWSQTVEPHLPEDRYGGQFAEHGYASHTPVSDGQRVYAYFGKTGALACDMEGNVLWQTQLGTGSDPRGWGSASSPILYENLLIVTASAEGEALVALDKDTGKVVWRKEAGGFSGTWGTPVLVEVDQTRTDLVLAVPYEFWGFDPATGKLRWYCAAMNTDSYCSSLVAADGVVYGIEGMGGGSIAVRVGGEGDVAKTHVVWTGRDNNRIGTPIVYDGRIYFFSRGVANCIDAKTGERIYQARLSGGAAATSAAGDRGGGPGPGRGFGGGQDYSSPVIAGGNLYYISRSGDGYVIRLGPKFEQLALNRLTPDREDFSATPAISDGELFIRSNKHLYCVSDKAGQ
jgi:outer membrane protein assembly factor BamB